jgi:hypothetical protein
VLICAILICVSWGTLLTFAILEKIAGTQFAAAELTSLALGGWPLPALLISVLLLSLHLFVPDNFIFGISLLILTAGMGLAIRAVWKHLSPDLIVLVFIFLFFVFIRLGFSANAMLPSYFDSAEHYRIIQALLSMEDGTKFAWPGTAYYHLGYHFIVAAITCITHANIGQVMLLFGQIIWRSLCRSISSPRTTCTGRLCHDTCRIRLVHASPR